MMRHLSRIEEIILISILKLDDSAYGVSIRDRINKDTGEKWSFASIYPPLDSLKNKGFVDKTKGDPLPERGGKSRYFYRITPAGKKMLIRIFNSRQKIWGGTEHLLWDSDRNQG